VSLDNRGDLHFWTVVYLFANNPLTMPFNNRFLYVTNRLSKTPLFLRGFLSGPRLPTLGLPLIAATIDTYSLVTPVLQRNAANKMDNVYGKNVTKLLLSAEIRI
jgi:hypothetical protein